MSNVREENIRLRIQAASDLPTVSDQLAELIKLQQQLMQTNQQYANQAAYARQDQTKAIQGVSDALKAQAKVVNQHDADVKAVNKSYTDLGSSVRDFVTLLGTAFTLNEFKSFTSDVIDAKTRIDSLKIALDTLLGSKRESTELYAQIVDLAKKTPFQLDELAENVVKLKGYGIETEKLIPTIEALGNMAAAVGKDKLPQLTLAYGQVRNFGKLMGDELRQFVEAGIPVYDLLAKSMGKTKDEVIKLAAAHKVSFADIEKAVLQASEVGGLYYNLMIRQSKTLGGEVSNLGDAYFLAKAKVGDFFENELKGGIRAMGQLIDATMGSESAINRSVTAIKSLVALYVTWQTATKAQMVVETAKNALMTAGNFIMGTYNAIMITAKGTTEGFTEAQIASASAAKSTWAALAANPLGAVVALIGLAASAWLAYDAATQKVDESMSEHEYQLKREQADLQVVAERAMSAAMGSDRRKESIEDLIFKYPDYFKGLDTEKTSNEDLKRILDKVNLSYAERIDLARQAYKTEKQYEKQRELFEQERAMISKLSKEVQDQIGGSLDVMIKKWEQGTLKGTEVFKNYQQTLTEKFLGQNKEISLEAIRANIEAQNQIQKNLSESLDKQKEIKDKDKAKQKEAEHEHYAVLIKQAAGNSVEIQRLKKEEAEAIAKIEGKAQKATVANVEETKKKVSQAYIELQELQTKQGEQTLQEEKRIAELQKKLKIEAIQESERSEKSKQLAIQKVVEEYAPKLADIETRIAREAQDKKVKEYAKREKELRDEITVIAEQQLEVEKILTQLKTANTQEARRAIMLEYGKRVTDDVKQQALAQLQIQRDSALKTAELLRSTAGEGSKEYKEALDNYLAIDKKYQAAKLAISDAALVEKFNSIKAAETKILELQKDIAEKEKRLIEEKRKFQTEAIRAVVDMLSAGSPALANFAGAILQVYNNMDLLSGKTQDTIKGKIKESETLLASLQSALNAGTAEGEAKIKDTQAKILGLKLELNEASMQSFQTAMGIFGAIYQAAKFIADAFNQAMKETYQAIADAFGNARKVVDDYYSFLIQKSQDGLKRELEAFQGTYEQKVTLIRAQYAEELRLAEGQEKLDAMLAYQQAVYQAQVDADGNVRKLMEGLAKARMDQDQREYEMQINAVNRELEMKKMLHDAKLQALQEELAAFQAEKQGEIDALNASLAAQKAALDQFYSDKQLRLQKDDVYRAELLVQGEAREVAALEAAKQRELDRATTAEERTRILNAFEQLIADVHAKYQDAVGDKTKEIALANTEAKAQEAEKTQALESETAKEIQRLKDEVAAKDKQIQQQMADENKNYAKQVILAEYEIANIKKAMIIGELRAEQAMLRGKRWFMNKNKVDSAIADIENAINEINATGGRTAELDKMQKLEEVQEAINQANRELEKQQAGLNQVRAQITSKSEEIDKAKAAGQDTSGLQKQLEDLIGQTLPIQFIIRQIRDQLGKLEEEKKKYMWTGTEYLDGTGYKKGIDTIPVMMTEGERILTVRQNQQLGGISNEDLVDRMLAYDRLMADFPQILSPDWSGIANTRIALPAEVMNYQQATTVNLDGLRQDLLGVRQAIEQKELLQMNVDANGFAFAQIGAQSKTQRVNQIMTR